MNSATEYLSMFLIGLLGSGHCLGMCGPLVIALPGRYSSWKAHWSYHGGRLLTYTAMGAVLAGISQGVTRLAGLSASHTLIWTSRVQILFSVLAAVILLLMGLNRIGLLREPNWLSAAAPQKIPGFRKALAGVRERRGMRWLFTMGLLLGFLPCGLSYAAFTRSLAADNMVEGAMLTASFGLGTLPALLLLGTGVAALFRRYRAQTEMVAGLIMIAMGVSLLTDAWTSLA